MRLIESIKTDISIVKAAIREAMAYGNEREVELFYEDLDELLEELHNAQTAVI